MTDWLRVMGLSGVGAWFYMLVCLGSWYCCFSGLSEKWREWGFVLIKSGTGNFFFFGKCTSELWHYGTGDTMSRESFCTEE